MVRGITEPSSPPNPPGARRRLQAQFPASHPGVAAARRALAAVARDCDMDEAAIEDVRLAASEAVTNAIIHGYREGPGEVTVTADADEGELVIVIADSGAGVLPRADSPGLGLGLSIIRSVTNRMEVSAAPGGGAAVLMAFARPSGVHETETDADAGAQTDPAGRAPADPSLIPPDEAERLAAVRRYDVLDTPPDGAFDRITALAAKHFGVPVSIVSIVDTDRIWFKSHHGIDVPEIDRDPGLCASAILHDAPWIVEDARTDPRTMANPLVAGEMGLSFYAGAQLTTADGHSLGTLCVIDQRPRPFSDEEAKTLSDMAAVVMDELELRLAARRVVDQESSLRRQAEEMARALQESLLPPVLPAVDGLDLAALYLPADAGVVGGDFYDVFEAGDSYVLVVGDVSGKGAAAAAVTALARHTIRTASLSLASPAEMLRTLNRAMFIGRNETDVEHFCTVLVVAARLSERGLALTVATGGHPPALLLRGDGSTAELKASGPPAGWYRDAPYTEAAFDLAPGETLVLFTDGITEARTPAGMLGSDGLAHALGASGRASATAVVDAIRATVSAPGTDVRDDAAALVLKATTR
ncbi:MAG: phosphoserine phosphatase RsbU/P [Solirubrobacteraceae bacterium]|nr:phosphoserine phosphatase RsbU/P [Solirubrobacteraceae bacterium]